MVDVIGMVISLNFGKIDFKVLFRHYFFLDDKLLIFCTKVSKNG